MITWIIKAVVLAIHDEQLAEHGGPSATVDENILESALAKPQNRLVYDLNGFDLSAEDAEIV